MSLAQGPSEPSTISARARGTRRIARGSSRGGPGWPDRSLRARLGASGSRPGGGSSSISGAAFAGSPFSVGSTAMCAVEPTECDSGPGDASPAAATSPAGSATLSASLSSASAVSSAGSTTTPASRRAAAMSRRSSSPRLSSLQDCASAPIPTVAGPCSSSQRRMSCSGGWSPAAITRPRLTLGRQGAAQRVAQHALVCHRQ
jgi:hypothetical protein